MVYGNLHLARDQQVYRLLSLARDLAFVAVVCRLSGHARDQCCLCCWANVCVKLHSSGCKLPLVNLGRFEKRV